MRGDTTRGEGVGRTTERMSDGLITFLLSQPAKHFPQLITDTSEVIIIIHDITLLNICSLTHNMAPDTWCHWGEPA